MTMQRTHAWARFLVLSAAALAATGRAQAAPIQDYIALGDSMAFGETDFQHNPSNGDRGYVKLFADSLAAGNGGVRPQVINLGVDGETTNTFFNGGPQGNSPGNPAPQLNTNYPATPTTQNALLLSDIASEKALGHTIGTVTVQIGANDLYALVLQPSFFTLTPAQQQAKIVQGLGTIQANETTLLTELKSLVPSAKVLLVGYDNPFNAVPGNPIAKLADPAIKALNAVIQGEAAAFGDKYVDTYSAFLGKEAKLTYIANGNVHPNAKGYQIIANQVELASAQSVPEPGSFLVAGVCLLGGLVVRRRRRTPA